MRSETGPWSIRLLLLTVPFLRFTSRLQAGKLLVKLAAHTRSSCAKISTLLGMHRNHKMQTVMSECCRNMGIQPR